MRRIVSYLGEDLKGFEEQVQSGEVDLDRLIDRQIDEMLRDGDVLIEGRSAFMLLDNEEVFKVLLVASKNKKADHLASRRLITVEDTREQIRMSDIERKHMVERLYKQDWLDPHLYNLVINTGLFGYEEAAAIIANAVRNRRL